MFLASFDLHHPQHEYVHLDAQLRQLKFAQLQPRLWAGDGAFTMTDLKRTLVRHLQPGDGVAVFDMTVNDYARHNPR